MAPETSSGFNNFGIDTIQGYGLTETSPVLAAERPEDLASGSVGKPLPNVNIMIAGEDENGIGEIIARGPNIMMGYMDQPEETAEVIRDLYEKTGYVIDTHTAVATGVYHKYVKETGDNTKTVIASTASPFKFTRSVMDAIDKEKYDSMTDFELVDELSKIANVTVPQAIEDIRSAEVLHKTECDVEDMPKTVKAFLNI